jgi:TonB-linked SusC/RagA family outer membrane protein
MNLQKLTRFVCLLLLLIISSMQLYAQGPKITGTVIDQKTGKPLAGVSVKVKNTTQSTITNEVGFFTIKAPSAFSIVTFSFVGYSIQEVKAGIAGVALNISLVDVSNELDDVVVIGYGTQKAKNITGSIVSINTKKLEDMPVASLSEMLKGQVPGLSVSGGSTRPGTMATLSIRQQFNWGKDGGVTIPLIVIDDIEQLDPSTNLPTLNTFNLLDLSEVESITVLRDASAAIYGPRGSQGAIIVRTKRGKIGAPKITYSGRFETSDAVSHSKVMSAKEYGIFSNRFFAASPSQSANLYFTPTELASMDSINYDWLHDWRSSGTMQHSINVSGGSEKATYFTGGSYYTQGANLGSQTFNRWTFRSGTDVKVGGGLKFSASISANNSNLAKSFTKISITDGYASGGEQNDYAILLHMPKYIPWQYNINGVDQYVAPVLKSNGIGSVSGNNSLSNWNYYSLLNNGSQTVNNSFSYNANFSLQYDIPFIKGLSIKGSYSKGSTSGNNEQDMMPLTLYQATNALTAGTHLFNANTVWSAAIINKSNSRVTYDNTTNTTEQINFFANYDRSFGNHNLSAVFVGERSQLNSDDRYQIYDSPIIDAYNGTSISAGTLNAANTITSKSIGGTMSYLGRVSYNYKSKYLAQFVLRSDASSKLAPENYWGIFPGMSVGWVISEEDFFKRNVSWVNNLKIRFSLGQTGNDNISAWKWEQLYDAATDKGMGFGSNGGNFTTGLTPGVTPYRDIKWDKTIQRNLGIDMTLLNNRLSISWDAYYNSGKNLITLMTGAINVPISTGGAFAEQNYANVNFWGTEVSANWNDHIGKVNYTIGMNFGLSGNKVMKYLDLPFTYPSQSGDGVKSTGYSLIGPQWGYRTWKGTSTGDGLLRTDADLDAYWGYLTDLATKAGGLPSYFGNITRISMKKGMLAYEDQAGSLNANTETVAGKNGQIVNDGQDLVKLKKSTQGYGITTNLGVTWKAVSFMAQIATSWGGYNSIDRVKQGTSSSNAMWSQVSYLNDMYDSATNVNGKYPNMYYYDNAYLTSDFWTLPTFRCVIRSLSIGYSLPKTFLDRMRISNARLVLSGNNLWDLYNPYPNKYRNMYDAPNVNYPTLRTWALGINLGF